MPTTLVLSSSDSKEFPVELDVISKSKTISTMMRDLGLEDMDTPMSIPLPNVNSQILEKILEWCRQHKDDEKVETTEKSDKRDVTVPEWDKEFLNVELDVFFSIMMAANYLDIPLLLDYSCKMAAEKLRNKTVEEMRAFFNIKCDLTPEEIAQIDAENDFII